MSHMLLWKMQLSFYLRKDEKISSGQKRGEKNIDGHKKKEVQETIGASKKQCNSQYDNFIRYGRY